ncbi:MAG: hypothetical protein WDN25_13995 [Acetobacteraceae bacterium]
MAPQPLSVQDMVSLYSDLEALANLAQATRSGLEMAVGGGIGVLDALHVGGLIPEGARRGFNVPGSRVLSASQQELKAFYLAVTERRRLFSAAFQSSTGVPLAPDSAYVVGLMQLISFTRHANFGAVPQGQRGEMRLYDTKIGALLRSRQWDPNDVDAGGTWQWDGQRIG